MMSFFNPLMTLGVMVSLSSVVSLCLQRKHLLNILLILELLMLSLFLLLMCMGNGFGGEGLMVFILLVFGACEASIGLSMLVILIRAYGNDYVSSLVINKC
uniref:NADH dehydrogenase subunit 4L n=1 Tax=Plaxiphora tricolor TaxID=2045497 RepID=UPI002E7A33F7|nr:NADH dehydrogenase subunit 4L [Plaxiphora tricolor]WRI60248.1 NADH dehydrogenase subunit 4L [Plaxiphora tricolor]